MLQCVAVRFVVVQSLVVLFLLFAVLLSLQHLTPVLGVTVSALLYVRRPTACLLPELQSSWAVTALHC